MDNRNPFFVLDIMRQFHTFYGHCESAEYQLKWLAASDNTIDVEAADAALSAFSLWSNFAGGGIAICRLCLKEYQLHGKFNKIGFFDFLCDLSIHMRHYFDTFSRVGYPGETGQVQNTLIMAYQELLPFMDMLLLSSDQSRINGIRQVER